MARKPRSKTLQAEAAKALTNEQRAEDRTRNLESFARAHDPMFEGDSPVPVWPWNVPAGTKRILVTAAQNATPVHQGWWAVLQTIMRASGAALVVLPIRYKNPTSTWGGSQRNAEHWVEEVRPHLVNVRHTLNENLMVLGDIKIQPTAGDPLTGFESVAGASSAIVGHTKIQTRSIATPQNRMAKLLMTSGACTQENYSDTRAGRVGAFHHSLSAVMVELDGKRFSVRRIHYDDKTRSATDAGEKYLRYYADGRVEPAPRALAAVLGDMHVPFTDPLVERATFGKGGLLDCVNPQHVVYHDVTDGHVANRHEMDHPLIRLVKNKAGRTVWENDVQATLKFIRERHRPNTKDVIVASNHEDFIEQYVLKRDWREDPLNAEFILETSLAMVRDARYGERHIEWPHPFRYWARKANLPDTIFLEEDQSFVLGGVELGLHGHRGPNGARGNIRNYRRLGVKTISGDSHTPGEDEGAMRVGVSAYIRMGYNKGPSGWLHAHGVLHADGKRQLIVIVDGRRCLTSSSK